MRQKIESKCSRCFREYKHKNCTYFIEYGISLKVNLCNICIGEFRELLNKFFMEIQNPEHLIKW